jgi:hypothetical protein
VIVAFLGKGRKNGFFCLLWEIWTLLRKEWVIYPEAEYILDKKEGLGVKYTSKASLWAGFLGNYDHGMVPIYTSDTGTRHKDS